MHFAHYLGRACIDGEEWKGKEIEIRDGLNQCATHITWDAHVFTERRGEGVVTNALFALPGTRLYLLRGEEREGERDKGWS